MIINKYPVCYNNSTQEIYTELPIGSRVLSFKIINNSSYVFAVVNELEARTTKREIIWLGTEWNLLKEEQEKIRKYQYLGTHEDVRPKETYYWHIWIAPEKQEKEYAAFYIENPLNWMETRESKQN